MFERLKRLYLSQSLSKDGIKNAVEKGLITKDQYREITGEDYDG